MHRKGEKERESERMYTSTAVVCGIDDVLRKGTQ